MMAQSSAFYNKNPLQSVYNNTEFFQNPYASFAAAAQADASRNPYLVTVTKDFLPRL